jgi:LytR cell envelope-related transcriptional attenuator
VPVNVPPPPPRASAKTGLATKVGALLGFVGLAVVGGLALLLLRRHRELTGLREQVGRAMALEALQRPAFAGVASPAAAGAATGAFVPPAGASPPQSAGAAPAPGAQAPDPGGPAAHGPPPRRAGSAVDGEGSTASAIGESRPTIYRAGLSRTRLLTAVAAVVLVIALVTFAVDRLTSGSAGGGAGRAAVVPVAVFNATGDPATARHVAHVLHAAHVRIAAVGGINAGLGRGAFVLYPPGAHAEAERVARLLPSLSPTVSPMPQQVSSAVAGRDEIVVVLD